MVIDRPDSTVRTFEMGAMGRPLPIRGFTRPVATRCTASWAARRSRSRRYPLREECLWWVWRRMPSGRGPVAVEHEVGQGLGDRDRLGVARLLCLVARARAGQHQRAVELCR